jgi:predicted XRE-type DNA-binding protein
MLDFFKGGEGFDAFSELEAIKKNMLRLASEIFVSKYNRDRKKFISDLDVTSSELDDIVNLRWGAFTLDYIVCVVDKLCNDEENRLYFNETFEFNLDTKEKSVLKAFKGHLADLITSLAPDSPDQKKVLYGAIKNKQLSVITLDFLVLEYLKLSNPQAESLLSIKKRQTADHINLIWKSLSLNRANFASLAGIGLSDASLIKGMKLKRFSLDRLTNILDRLQNKRSKARRLELVSVSKN